jgi:Icc-related predicted phosphoesterase
MKFALGSDLHLEFNTKNCPYKNKESADVLILAGDITDSSCIKYDVTGIIEPMKITEDQMQWFYNISNEFSKIIWVFGNHEYYHGDISTAKEQYKQFLKNISIDNIQILEDERIEINGINIIGSTLWTNFCNNDPIVRFDCQRIMNDYRKIKISGRKLTSEDIYEKHEKSFKFITESIQDKPNIIVTHHQPTDRCVQYELGNHNISYAYYSNYFDFILNNTDKINTWVSGHTHSNMDYMIEKTRMITNCRGYYGHEPMVANFELVYFDV